MQNLQILENTNHFQVHYYIAIKFRPDIAYAFNQASRNCEQPTTIDYKALLLILQYLKSTINKSIYYNRKIDQLDFQMLITLMMKPLEDLLVDIYSYLEMDQFPGNHKFKEMLHYQQLKLNLLVLLNAQNMEYG